jgi:N-acetylglucosaminyldiphosphoundecaprenol N-acetyl-beta-D-mannosaminyltransferase
VRISLCGVGVDACTMEEAVDKIVAHAEAHGAPAYVVTPNAQHYVALRLNRRFREIYRLAFLSLADGVPLLWAARLLGTPLAGRVNGTDIFEHLCAAAAKRGLRIFLLGGRRGAAERAAEVLKEKYSKLNIVGTYCPPVGFERDRDEIRTIDRRIRTAMPDILFVGLGAPKQEYWIQDYHKVLGIPVSLGIGNSFEFVAGMVRRAPRWMQSSGMEWAFRLLTEPQRLWKRYVFGNPQFVWMVLQYKFFGKSAEAGSALVAALQTTVAGSIQHPERAR